MTLECPYCNKPYTNKPAFRRHILICGSCPEDDFCDGKTPPLPQVYQMLVELTRRHHLLLTRFDALKKQTPARTRRLGLVDWLKRTQLECPSYQDWRDKLQISRADLELVFRIGHRKGVTQILENVLPAGGLGDGAPLRSFTQYPTILFLNDQSDSWRPASADDVQGLVAAITRQLARELSRWQADNMHLMGSETFMNEFPKKVRTATGADHPLPVAAAYVKSRLCAHLRCQACTLIECEVTGPGADDHGGGVKPSNGKRRLQRNTTHTGV